MVGMMKALEVVVEVIINGSNHCSEGENKEGSRWGVGFALVPCRIGYSYVRGDCLCFDAAKRKRRGGRYRNSCRRLG